MLRSTGLATGSALSAAVLSAFTRRGQTFPGLRGFEVALLVASALGVATAMLSYALAGRPPTSDLPPGRPRT